MQKIEPLMAKNILKLAAFAFKRINGIDELAIMTRQRMTDGRYELPSEEFVESDTDNKAMAVRCLSKSFSISDDFCLFPVGTYATEDDGEKLITSVYGFFLNDWPGAAFGINWMGITPNGALAESLSGNDDAIFADAKKALAIQVICSSSSAISAENKKKLLDLLVSKDDLKTLAENLGEYGVSRKKYAYDFWHAGQAVDIIVLAAKFYKVGKTDYVDLMIPLIKRSEGVGKGWWGLPGGFVKEEDFREAGWNGMETDFDPRAFPKYRNALKDGGRAVTIAAKRNLKAKTGIELDDDATIYPLFLRDNPLRGTADGVPVVAETLLTIISDFDKFKHLTHDKDTNVEDVDWFPIKRFYYNEQGGLVKQEGESFKRDLAVQLSSDKRSPYDLRNRLEETDAYIQGNSLIVNYFKGDQLPVKAEGRIDLFADHRDAIIDALQYVKEKTHTSTILADFLIKNREDALAPENVFDFGNLRLLYEALLFPEETTRQNLSDMIVVNENKGNNGFLEKPSENTRGRYRFNMEKFNEFLYRKVSIF